VRVVGGGAGDVKEPLPLYLKQRALLGWAVQGDGAAVVMMVMGMVVIVIVAEERGERRGRAWWSWCGGMGSTAARIGRGEVCKSGLPEEIVDDDGVGEQVKPYEVVDGRGPMAW
jgi:hypothetical protein